MSQRIVTSGRARNLVASPGKETVGPPDSTERKFVTFINDQGAVHTIVADLDHPAQDAQALLDYHNEARTIIEMAHSEGNPARPTPFGVAVAALARCGLPVTDQAVIAAVGSRSSAVLPQIAADVKPFGGEAQLTSGDDQSHNPDSSATFGGDN